MIAPPRLMRVLVACEFSGVVRNAFIMRGHEAISCDLLPSELPGPHYQGDVRDILNEGWDMMIAHPPCTYLTVTGNKWFKPEYADRFPGRERLRMEAVEFFMLLASAPIKMICIENPVGVMSSYWRKPDQIIDPTFFGHSEPKKTCLWLKNLSRLRYGENIQMEFGETSFLPSTEVLKPDYITTKSGKRMPRWYAYAPKENRSQLRSATFIGIAHAMADQWG